jgi:IclR family pca regulon transcriptional regulator
MPERTDLSSKKTSRAATRRGARGASTRQSTGVIAVGRQDPKFSQSLERGLAILSCFTVERSLLGIAEMADQLGLSRSTTHRYATTLVELGYLEQEDDRKYRLGLRVTDLGSSALGGTGLREHAYPHLQRLRGDTGLASGLAALDGTEIVYIERLRAYNASPVELDVPLAPGSRLQAHSTAAGKLLLACLPIDERERTVKQMDDLSTKKRRELLGELEQISQQGFASNDAKGIAGGQALAVAVRDHTGEVIAAVNLIGSEPKISTAQLLGDHKSKLQATAKRISAQLGH